MYWFSLSAKDMVVLCTAQKKPTGTRRPVDVPESFPEGPKFRDLQGTFRGFSGDRWKKL